MYIKIHESKNSRVVAVCDKQLIGKKLNDGNVSILISERFYKGDEIEEAELITILKDADNINLMGKKAIEAGLKAGVIRKENIKTIQGVPHAQSFSL